MKQLLAIFLAVFLSSLVRLSVAGELHIAVAANFLKPMEHLIQQFSEKTGHKLQMSAGSTGKLYAQIKNGAPYEVFFAADLKRPQLLIEAGNALADSFFVYAQGELVLWSTVDGLVDAQGAVLKTREFNHIALANVKTAPYGTAAKQVLEKLGVWETYVQGHKIVQGSSLTETYRYIATGSAELGFVALSQFKIAEANDLVGSAWKVDKSLYDPIAQGAVILKAGENNPVSAEFFKFVQTNKQAQQLIESYGYAIPEMSR